VTDTARLGLPLIATGQAGAHVTVNTALATIDDKLGHGWGALGGFVRLAVHEIELAGLSGASVTAAVHRLGRDHPDAGRRDRGRVL